MAISQTISTFPTPLPNRNTQTPSEFSDSVDAFLGTINSYVAETNTWSTEANTLATDVNSDAADAAQSVTDAADQVTLAEAQVALAESAAATSESNANFKGNWDDQTGEAAIPYSVRNDSKTWQLISYLADVTTVEPGVTGGWATYWADITALVEGDPIDMADALLTAPKFIDVSETVNVLGDTGGGSDDIDWELGNFVTATVSTEEQTFTFSNWPTTGDAGGGILVLTNGGSQIINWEGAEKWVGGEAPTLTAAGIDWVGISSYDAGTTISLFVIGLDVK